MSDNVDATYRGLIRDDLNNRVRRQRERAMRLWHMPRLVDPDIGRILANDFDDYVEHLVEVITENDRRLTRANKIDIALKLVVFALALSLYLVMLLK